MALNTPMKIVLTMVIIFLIGIGFYLLDYSRKLTELKSFEEDFISKKEQLKTNEERVRALPKQLNRKENLTKELDALLQERLPQEDAAIFVPKFIQSMEDLVSIERKATGDTTMEVISITPGTLEQPDVSGKPEDAKTDAPKALMLFPKQPFQVSFKARFGTVIHFLHQLAALKLQRLVTIQKIALAPAENPVYGQSPALSVTMPMVAYLNEGKK